MKKIYFSLFCATLFNFSFSQVLGIYDFTGTGACPNQNPNVASQPTNGTFSPFTSASALTCVAANNVYNFSGWNPSTTIDLTLYYEFSLTASAGKVLNLDSLIFASKVSSNTATWYLRSNLDNYASNISTNQSTTTLDTNRIKLTTNFSNINAVTFRFYVSSVTDNLRTWRVDDVTVKGAIVSGAGVKQLSNSNFTLYPNPADDCITLCNLDNDNLSISIISNDGRVLHEINSFSSSEIKLNTSNLKSGMYFVRISSNEVNTTLPWIKK